MPPPRRRSSRPKVAASKKLEQLWRLGLIAVLILALLPGDFAFVDYGKVLAVQSYALVKASMPFIPLGFLLALVWRRAEIQLVTLVMILVLPPALWPHCRQMKR
jgi:Na+/proline symporter